jgi:cell wall assembly regulator SMI1
VSKHPQHSPHEAITGTSCAELLARLERWLSKHRKGYRDGLLPGASAAELDALQTDLGMTLPADLRILLAWHNGQSDDFVGHFEQDWDLMSCERIRVAKKEIDADAPTGWQRAWIPILDDDAGDYRVLDTAQPAAPVREFWQGRSDQAVIAPSFSAWLADFVAAVERGAYQEDPERGTFLRRQDL